MKYVLVIWLGCLLWLLATPRGRATLARSLSDMASALSSVALVMADVLGFRRRQSEGGGMSGRAKLLTVTAMPIPGVVFIVVAGPVLGPGPTIVASFGSFFVVAVYLLRRQRRRRWHELAAEDAADPALRRAAVVKDAYLAGEFGYDELDWRILLALVPPPPALPAPSSDPWMLEISGCFVPVPACSFHELHSGSGYVATVCDCGHDMAMHYNGGCNDCDAFRRMDAEPVHQFPRPQMQEIGKPPEARSARRQSHG